MSRKRKKHALAGVGVALIGLLCAAVLCVLFYGTMVYQLSGEAQGGVHGARLASTPAPLDSGTPFPGALLTLGEGALLEESAQDVYAGGQTCRVVTRRYALANGAEALAVSAAPAAYLEILSQERFEPRLITGFVLAGLDAVYETRGDEALLASRDGDFVYLLRARATEQEIYALGAGASLEGR